MLHSFPPLFVVFLLFIGMPATGKAWTFYGQQPIHNKLGHVLSFESLLNKKLQSDDEDELEDEDRFESDLLVTPRIDAPLDYEPQESWGMDESGQLKILTILPTPVSTAGYLSGFSYRLRKADDTHEENDTPNQADPAPTQNTESDDNDSSAEHTEPVLSETDFKALVDFVKRLAESEEEDLFHFTFDQQSPNTKAAAEKMEDIIMLLIWMYPKAEEILLQMRQEIDQHMISIQRNEIPEHAPDGLIAHSCLVRSPTMGVGGDPVGVALINMLFECFAYVLQVDYFMYGRVDRLLCKSIADLIEEAGETKVLELMAGAGWLQKGLSEQGLDVDAVDDFSLVHNNDYLDSEKAAKMKKWYGMAEHRVDFKTIPGAKVRDQDALKALQESDRKVVILQWPHPDPALISAILELCYRTDKMIIYIAPNDETFENLFVKEVGEEDYFVDIPEAPFSFIYGQYLRAGTWRSLPRWIETQQQQYRQSYEASSSYTPGHIELGRVAMAMLRASRGVVVVSVVYGILKVVFS